MNAIDAVANIRGGGAWLNKDNTKYYEHSKISENTAIKMPKGYLMCSYDVYVKREPCLMCAMALVHSRVRRVFFNKLSAKGALHSLTKLHTIEELNHSFEVYRMFKTNEI